MIRSIHLLTLATLAGCCDGGDGLCIDLLDPPDGGPGACWSTDDEPIRTRATLTAAGRGILGCDAIGPDGFCAAGALAAGRVALFGLNAADHVPDRSWHITAHSEGCPDRDCEATIGAAATGLRRRQLTDGWRADIQLACQDLPRPGQLGGGVGVPGLVPQVIHDCAAAHGLEADVAVEGPLGGPTQWVPHTYWFSTLQSITGAENALRVELTIDCVMTRCAQRNDWRGDPLRVDPDRDGIHRRCDRCPAHFDPDQPDRDGDGAGDACDLCPDQPDDQRDRDGDGAGDACDTCPLLDGAPQRDRDGDGVGDACDRCPDAWDPTQRDRDGDGRGDACDVCPDVADREQRDGDGDGVGDACDLCPDDPDADQTDTDGDEVGDVCDNCPDDDNPDQQDADELTPWALDYPGGDACDPPGRPVPIITAPIPAAALVDTPDFIADYVVRLGGHELPWAQLVDDAAQSLVAPAPGEPVAQANRAPLPAGSVVMLPEDDPLDADRARDVANARIGFRVGRHFEDVMKGRRCVDMVDPDTGFVLQEALREYRYFRPSRNPQSPTEVLLGPGNRPRYRRADCYYGRLGGVDVDGSVLPWSLPARIEEYKASRARGARFSDSYRRRIREQALDLKWFVAVKLREEFFPDRPFIPLYERLHERTYWPWGKPPLALYRCVPAFMQANDCAPALREAFGGLLHDMRAARDNGAGTAFQWTVDTGLAQPGPEWMAGCRTPPRQWFELDGAGDVQVRTHCDWGAWIRNSDAARFQLMDNVPVADGMYVDADWYNPHTRAINEAFIAVGQEFLSAAVVAFWPYGFPFMRGLMHDRREPQAPLALPGGFIQRQEPGWWLLVSLDDLVLMQGIPAFDIDGDEAYDLALE